LSKADIVILPGTKSTLSDLYELRRNGVAQSILKAHRDGATVLGICGGYQLMGVDVCDPDGVEGEIPRLPGLGLLPISTVMKGEKVTRQVSFRFLGESAICKGYEIHMGETKLIEGEKGKPLNQLEQGSYDGCFVNQRCFGTYIHGILDNPTVIDALLAPYTEKLRHKTFDYQAFKEEQYDKLADHVREHTNMDLLYEILQSNHTV
jgi:adenosylcobyric acid synthase